MRTILIGVALCASTSFAAAENQAVCRDTIQPQQAYQDTIRNIAGTSNSFKHAAAQALGGGNETVSEFYRTFDAFAQAAKEHLAAHEEMLIEIKRCARN